jgi:hypothetical protein
VRSALGGAAHARRLGHRTGQLGFGHGESVRVFVPQVKHLFVERLFEEGLDNEQAFVA